MDGAHTSPLADAAPRVKRAILLGTAAIALAGTAGTALLPSLSVRHPALLLLLAPNYLALVAPRVDFPTAFAIVSLRRLLGMCAYYGFGGVYGDAALQFFARRAPRLHGFMRWVEGRFRAHGAALIVLFPGATTALVAGVAGMPFARFALAGLVGQLVWTAVFFRFSLAIGALTTRILGFLEAHLVESSAAFLAAVAAQQLVARMRRATTTPPPSAGTPR